MRSAIFVALVAMATASPALRRKRADKLLVTSDALKADIKAENLMAGAQKLQTFAGSQSNGTRSIGTPGHINTINWIKEELDATGYYTVELQTFNKIDQLSAETKAFFIGGENVEGNILEFSPSGSVTADIVHVPNEGCEAVLFLSLQKSETKRTDNLSLLYSDYPASVTGKVALVARGECDFGTKSALAGGAGAAAMIVYNNAPGVIDGTLGGQPRTEGPYVPTVAISQELGNSTTDAINGGASITAVIDIITNISNISTSNVVATTKTGDQDNKLSLGAHTDSVPRGPGLNDNGSGMVTLLEVAKALPNYSINNAVTFGFWSAEEWGFLGSLHYTDTLPETELAKIRAYLNFDMLATKNHILGVYDGTSTLSNITFPAGSADIQSLFTSYFNSSSLPSVLTNAAGRSDDYAFLKIGIPVGGLFAGGPDNKTEEEAKLFGGKSGVRADSCFHLECDNIENLNPEVWEVMAKGVAHAVATYAVSWGEFPERSGAPANRTVKRAGKMVSE